ncbi:MAG: DNA polymerase, partial [Patescibacteria group bacterium]|nr:DNA polymerase [Patescibacteria group bacterium]
MPKQQKKFIIIDGNALLHRAWHALPPLTTSDGTMVNAVYGFASIMLTIIKELKPDYGVVAFDPPGTTFRHERYKEYKATREKQPDELYEQIPLIKEVAKDFGFRVEEKAGYEADDVIGTLAAQASKHNVQTIIVTGDMDALQLVCDDVSVFTIKRGISDTIMYDVAAVREKHGFGPEKVVAYKALAGDSSDNIPGVAGVGEKTAKELLAQFDSVKDIYAYLEKGGGSAIKASVAKKLLASKENAFLSEELATINCEIPGIAFSLKDMEVTPANEQDLLELFRKFEFRSLVSRAQEVFGNYSAKAVKGQGSLFSGSKEKDDEDFNMREGYHLIDSKEAAIELAQKLEKAEAFAVDTETDSLGALTSKLLGASVSRKPGEAYYILAAYVPKLKGVLENPRIKKYGHNIKYDMEVLKRAGISLAPVSFDSMIASYLLNPASRSHSLDNLAFVEFRHQMVPISSLIGPRGKKQLSLGDVDLARVADYACEDADYTLRLCLKLAKRLSEEKLDALMRDMEMPLVSVLANMEEAGVKIDFGFLEAMSKKLGTDIAKLEKKIFKEAGGEFNVASPLQLKEVLFGTLGLSTRGIGKTKTGFSTAAEQLEKMRDMHPIIPLIMEHRELSKLKNTYLDALPLLVNRETKRVHTSFNQTVASTGRLSSSEPNL